MLREFLTELLHLHIESRGLPYTANYIHCRHAKQMLRRKNQNLTKISVVGRHSFLRRVFGPKRVEVAGGLRRLHNEELQNLNTTKCY
jgi:hypothetical protein